MENLILDKVTILKEDFQEHRTKGKTSRIPIDRAIEKYGIEAFTYEVIEECSLKELNSREQY